LPLSLPLSLSLVVLFVECSNSAIDFHQASLVPGPLTSPDKVVAERVCKDCMGQLKALL
jgi:hypothetical protein